MPASDQPLWRPSRERIAAANLTRFMAEVGRDRGIVAATNRDLYGWSIAQPEHFWQAVWSFCGVVADTQGDVVLLNRDRMPGAQFFPKARLNYAENLLRRRDDAEALVFWGENKVKRRLTYDQLYDRVSQLVLALLSMGVQPGDRIAGYVPNMPETVIAMLAAASIGAIWSSCSPDFGPRGVVDRFGQIGPRVLFAADGYHYNGKTHDSLARVAEFLPELPTVERVVVFPYTRESPDLSAGPGARAPRSTHPAGS